MMDLLEGNRLQGLLENKIHFLEEMLTCSKLMADLTYEGHEFEYNNLLTTREQCIAALTSIESSLQNDLKTIVFEPIVDEKFVVLNAQAQKLVEDILVLDQQNKIEISNELQNIKTKIKALSRGRKGITGYQASQRFNVAGAYTDSRK
jgi:hypothetical protein